MKKVAIKIIKSEADYENALQSVYHLMDAKEGTPEFDTLEVLSMLVEKYEEEHFPIAKPNPIEAIKFRMEQMNFSVTQLGEILGYKSRASEVLNRKRKLTLPMIRRLNQKLNIPTDVLIQDY